jgi:hypothetical protein
MAYVAISRARDDARIYTDSTQNLSEALNRGIAKTTALEAVQANNPHLEIGLTRNEPSSLTEHSFPLDEAPTQNDPTLHDINTRSFEERDQKLPTPATSGGPPYPSSQELDHDLDLLH